MGRSLALVVPLLVGYEVLMPALAPQVQNTAEWGVSRLLNDVPIEVVVLVRRLCLSALVLGVVGWSLWSRRKPATVARPHLMLGEAAAFALVLGPAVGALVRGFGLPLSATPVTGEVAGWVPYALSVGAGLWEEIVFRLGLMGGLTLLGTRVLKWNRAGSLGVALVGSSLLFAAYHHFGAQGEPFEETRFVFRSAAGTILGLVFAWRGFAVVVYMHVFYDLLCDLRLDLMT